MKFLLSPLVALPHCVKIGSDFDRAFSPFRVSDVSVVHDIGGRKYMIC